MKDLNELTLPSKEERMEAIRSYNALEATLKELKSSNPEVEIEETGQKIRIPIRALRLLGKILNAIGKGNPISVVPTASEMTTQAAAEILGCSRPHVIKLLEEGKIPFTKVGRHRRLRLQDVMTHRKSMISKRETLLTDLMTMDEEDGLYDS